MKRKPKPKPKKRAWFLEAGSVVCYPSDTDACRVASLIIPKYISDAHDEDLTQCTKEINGILKKARKNNPKKGADLHFLSTPSGLMLAWASCNAVSAEDDPATINKALGIR